MKTHPIQLILSEQRWHWGYENLTEKAFVAFQDPANEFRTSLIAEIPAFIGNDTYAKLLTAAPELLGLAQDIAIIPWAHVVTEELKGRARALITRIGAQA